MPRKMAEFHEAFNHVALDYINLVRSQRNQDHLLLDVLGSLNMWSLECMLLLFGKTNDIEIIINPAAVCLFVLGKRLGCLEKVMPQECKGLVDDVHTMLVTTSKMMSGLPFHKLWKNKNWKTLVSSMDGMLSYAGGLVNEKVKRIELAEEGDGLETEEGMDFLTYMLHSSSGKMTVEEIAVNAIDLIIAGVDTVSESV